MKVIHPALAVVSSVDGCDGACPEDATNHRKWNSRRFANIHRYEHDWQFALVAVERQHSDCGTRSYDEPNLVEDFVC